MNLQPIQYFQPGEATFSNRRHRPRSQIKPDTLFAPFLTTRSSSPPDSLPAGPSRPEQTNPRKKRKKARSAPARKQAAEPTPKARPRALENIKGRTVTLPLEWFLKPVAEKLKAEVRPPTASTRRSERSVEMRMPMEVFEHLVSPFEDGELENLARVDGVLQPTSQESKAFLEYKYLVSVPSKLNKFWALEDWDKPRKKGAWRRGRGASKLHLSIAAQERGVRTSLLSTVCGNMELRLQAPRDQAAMPTGRILFKVMTTDANGHVIWPTTFGPKTKAAMKKLAKTNLQEMVLDTLYPTLAMETALTATGSDSTWTPPPPPPPPAN